MTQRLELIKRLRLGASISRERNLNLDFAEIADEAADELEAAGEPVAWCNMLDTVVDIYFDGTTNPEKHRTYVEGAFDEVMDEAKKLLATHPAPLVPMTRPDLTHACEIELVTGKKCAKQCRFCASGIAMLTAAPPAAKAQQTHGLLLWATLDEALDAYWSAAYAEGQQGATHDTKDGRAQCALEAVRSCVRLAVAAEREA